MLNSSVKTTQYQGISLYLFKEHGKNVFISPGKKETVSGYPEFCILRVKTLTRV